MPHTIVGIGEALWDVLPGEKHLGGAPLNFSYIASLLGNRAVIASRIGNDALGADLMHEVSLRGLETQYIQQDANLPTGTAMVKVSAEGQPAFEISQPVAWDAFEWTEEWERLAECADAVCFGTLAQRSAASRAAIKEFLRKTRNDCVAILDVNLRTPFYSVDAIMDSLERATIAKINEDEFAEIGRMVELPRLATSEVLRVLARKFDLQLVCLTRGDRGSLLATSEHVVGHPGFQVEVKDTIGAGDAFAAAVAHCWVSKVPLERTSDIANRWASWVASQPGGMPLLANEHRSQMSFS
jgi:fructokinase